MLTSGKLNKRREHADVALLCARRGNAFLSSKALNYSLLLLYNKNKTVKHLFRPSDAA